MIDEHIDRRADVTIAAQPVTPEDAPGMGIFRFDADGQIVGFEEKPSPERLSAIGSSTPAGARFMRPAADKPFVASMGIYVFTRDVLLESLERHAGVDFGHEIIPAALGSRRVNAVPLPRLLEGRRDRRVVLRRQHHADPPARAVQLLRPAATGLHAAALPARTPASTTAPWTRR